MPQTPPCVACGEPLEGWEGHSCYKCVQGLAEQRDDLFDEVMKLRYENKILKEGLPIEKAKEGVVHIVEKHDHSVDIAWLDDYQTPARDWLKPDGDYIDSSEIKRAYPTGLTFETSAFPLPTAVKEDT